MAVLGTTPNSISHPTGIGAKAYADLVNPEIVDLHNRAPRYLLTVGGTANTVTATSVPAITSMVQGMAFWFVPTAPNTGPVTINIDGVGAVSLRDVLGAVLTGGAYLALQIALVVFDGTNLRLLSGGSGGGSSGTMPVGSIFGHFGSTALAGTLPLEGGTYSRTAYSDLFGVWGVMFGAGDGSTTFDVWDGRGLFLRGWDNTAAVDPDAASRTDRGDGTTGDNPGTGQGDGLGSHSHTGSGTIPDSITSSSGGGFMAVFAGSGSSINAPVNITINAAGGNETRPINSAILWCVKY